MFGPPLMVAHMAVSEGLLASSQGVAPRGVWAVLAGMYRDKVSYRTAEDTESWRQSRCGVRCVPVIKHGPLELADVQFSLITGVTLDHALDGFDAYLSATVGVWERHGGATVADAVVGQKRLRLLGGELWSTIAGQLFSDAEGAEDAVEAVAKASATLLRSFDDGPVRVPVNDDEI